MYVHMRRVALLAITLLTLAGGLAVAPSDAEAKAKPRAATPLPPFAKASAGTAARSQFTMINPGTALALCRETFLMIRASLGAPAPWQVKAALASAVCGVAAGAYLGQTSANVICWLTWRPAWLGGGPARWFVRTITAGTYDRC